MRGLAIVVLCFAINMADGIDVTIVSYIAPRLQADWTIGGEVMGRVFGAGLLGMAIGSMAIAPLADRIGRRKVILAALVIMSVGMIASSRAGGPGELIVLRILVGIGIGTVIAAMAAMVSESVPVAKKEMAVTLVQSGYSFAAIFTGLFVAHFLPIYGWRMLIFAAGMMTVVLLPAAWVILVEPVRREGEEHVKGRGRISSLFTAAFRSRTLALWGAGFFGLMVLYFVISWIPKLAIQAGLSETNGIYAGAIYNLGGFIGTVAMGMLSLRVPLSRLVAIMLTSAVVAMMVFATVTMSVTGTLAIIFLIGALLQGGYGGVWPLAAAAYPSEIRATGVGWTIGIGRGGAVIGPMLGGMLMDANVSFPMLFAAYCGPLLLCAGLIVLAGRYSSRGNLATG